MTTHDKTTRDQSFEQMFIDELDSIYYPGYAEKLSVTDMEKLQWELKEFQSQFSKKK